jgi:hypothetical protein
MSRFFWIGIQIFLDWDKIVGKPIEFGQLTAALGVVFPCPGGSLPE